MGRWDGHTLKLGGVGRMAAEHRSIVAADCGGREMSEAVRRPGQKIMKRAGGGWCPFCRPVLDCPKSLDVFLLHDKHTTHTTSFASPHPTYPREFSL